MTVRFPGAWQDPKSIGSHRYKCGYCDSMVGSDKGYLCYFSGGTPSTPGRILICPHCNRPTFFDELIGEQNPTAMIGDPVNNLSGDIGKLYEEARESASAGAYTSTVLTLRKLLMNVAVSKGAEKDKDFVYYVEFLTARFAPESKSWLDQIRKKGNEANHEIALMGMKEASNLLDFTEMLLRIVYDFPSRVSTSTGEKQP